ncbi:peptidase S8/S53 domain-containing protein [Daedaleopsis nitida]|nr:peptidase S8/S53 domain-containing protein [Daedaleopsis nitida]
MIIGLLILLFALGLAAHDLPQRQLSNSFRPLRSALPDSSVELLLSLPPSDIDGLHAALADVSDPHSPNYGSYLSREQVDRFVSPNPDSVRAVRDWLAKNNISADTASSAGDLLRVQVPVDIANSLLNASFLEFHHEQTNTTVLRTLNIALPTDVQAHLSFIYPTTQFIPPLSRSQSSYRIIDEPYPTRRATTRRSSVSSQCQRYTTPECLQEMYSIPATPATTHGNSIAVGGFLNEIATNADLRRFSEMFRPDIANPTFTAISVEDGPVNGTGTREASLDIEYTVGLATNTLVEYISVGNTQYDGLLDLTNYLLGQNELPSVLTVSYGVDEAVFDQYPEIAHLICNGYAQLGARGTTVIFSAGDGGVAGHHAQGSSACDAGRPFSPSFPSTCPYVTSVGGTISLHPEVAAPFSSGGFSNIFPQPAYQSTSVPRYLSSLASSGRGPTSTNDASAYAGRYNASGRAYPDVALRAADVVVCAQGAFYAVNGTSAAAPAFAGVVALLNAQRRAAALPPLGFLNPLLYAPAAARAFNDVALGSNPGCGTDGFPARAGWDPVTGLGTPAYNRLLAVVMGSAPLDSGAARRFFVPRFPSVLLAFMNLLGLR